MVFQIVTPSLSISIIIVLGIMYGLPLANPHIPQIVVDTAKDDIATTALLITMNVS
jgi:hypothetical protein